MSERHLFTAKRAGARASTHVVIHAVRHAVTHAAIHTVAHAWGDAATHTHIETLNDTQGVTRGAARSDAHGGTRNGTRALAQPGRAQRWTERPRQSYARRRARWQARRYTCDDPSAAHSATHSDARKHNMAAGTSRSDTNMLERHFQPET